MITQFNNFLGALSEVCYHNFGTVFFEFSVLSLALIFLVNERN